VETDFNMNYNEGSVFKWESEELKDYSAYSKVAYNKNEQEEGAEPFCKRKDIREVNNPEDIRMSDVMGSTNSRSVVMKNRATLLQLGRRPLTWDGTYIGTFGENEVKKLPDGNGYYLICINGWWNRVYVLKVRNAWPIVADEAASLFGIAKLGSHWGIIKGKCCVIYSTENFLTRLDRYLQGNMELLVKSQDPDLIQMMQHGIVHFLTFGYDHISIEDFYVREHVLVPRCRHLNQYGSNSMSNWNRNPWTSKLGELFLGLFAEDEIRRAVTDIVASNGGTGCFLDKVEKIINRVDGELMPALTNTVRRFVIRYCDHDLPQQMEPYVIPRGCIDYVKNEKQYVEPKEQLLAVNIETVEGITTLTVADERGHSVKCNYIQKEEGRQTFQVTMIGGRIGEENRITELNEIDGVHWRLRPLIQPHNEVSLESRKAYIEEVHQSLHILHGTEEYRRIMGEHAIAAPPDTPIIPPAPPASDEPLETVGPIIPRRRTEDEVPEITEFIAPSRVKYNGVGPYPGTITADETQQIEVHNTTGKENEVEDDLPPIWHSMPLPCSSTSTSRRSSAASSRHTSAPSTSSTGNSPLGCDSSNISPGIRTTGTITPPEIHTTNRAKKEKEVLLKNEELSHQGKHGPKPNSTLEGIAPNEFYEMYLRNGGISVVHFNQRSSSAEVM